MPSQILHTLFGEDVAAGLYRRLQNESNPHLEPAAGTAVEKINRDYRGVFTLGCQGPDIFYHSQYRRPVALEYGSLLHRRGYGMFSAGLLKMGLPGPPFDKGDIRINTMGVYALGFMTHAILDRYCHPYIIYKAGKNYHSFFERIIDVLMLKELRNQDAASWDQGGILAAICENPPPGLKERIVWALAAAFPEKVNKDKKLAQRIDNTFADCARFYHLTAPAETAVAQTSSTGSEERPVYSSRALAYVFPENLSDEIDFLNLNRKPWFYPYIPPNSRQTPQADTRSFPEIYAAALEAAIDALAPCIIQYLDSGIFPAAEAAGNIGDNGLSIQDEEGKPCAPNLSDPLPLDEVLRQQGKMRGMM